MITDIASILQICGEGSYLQIGIGHNAMAFELLRQPSDESFKLDFTQNFITKNLQRITGASFEESINNFAFGSQTFDTIIVGNKITSLKDEEILTVFKALHLITTHNFVLLFSNETINTLANHKRSLNFWEKIAFQAGFRRHPRSMLLNSYIELENEQIGELTFFERIVDNALEQFPLYQLNNTYFTDMLRESGRRADAHIWRYILSSTRIQPGDVVIDAACGLGYGTAILAACSPGARFMGVDINPEVTAYAEANYGVQNSLISYHTADVSSMEFLPNHSVDILIAFDTLVYIKDYDIFLREAQRVLKPEGRIIGSVPNLWCDEISDDQNQNPLNVFDWEKLRRDISKYFIIDGRWAQLAGGGFKLPQGKREFSAIDLDYFAPLDAEWWIFSAKMDPELISSTQANSQENVVS